jgi:cytochrome c-type biogenesis protein CcmH
MSHRWLLILIVIGLAWSGLTRPLAAQGSGTTTRQVTADEVNEVARQIWCPLCSGVRLDSCELKACEQMRQEIALKLAAGEDAESIKSYFLAQYGPQILGEPPREGFNWLAWVLPFVALGGGAIFLVARGRSLFTSSAGAHARPSAQVAPEDEPYARRLEEELKRYG